MTLSDRLRRASACLLGMSLLLLSACSPPAPLPRGGSKVPSAERSSSTPRTPAADPFSRTGTPVPTGQMEEVPATVAALAQELAAGKTSERDKALAFYDWVAKNIRYDIVAYQAGNYPDPSPEVTFSTRSGVCEGYARLFVALCHAVGMEAEMVPGYSKGFAPDEDKSQPDHAWNAVKIDGKWVLLDPTWGSGHIDQGKDFVAEFSRDWFETPPDQFVATHLPEDPRWQLRSPAMTSSDFFAQPSLSNRYFDYGLTLLSHPKGKISTDGPFQVKISSDRDCRMMAALYQGSNAMPGTYTLVERTGRENLISVEPPAAGKYSLVVFVGPPDQLQAQSAVVYQVAATGGGSAEFPKTLRGFDDHEVRLVAPRHNLRPDQEVEIVVQAPGARDLMAVQGEKQTPFQRDGDTFRLYLYPEGAKVGVFGAYDESNSYKGLLEYSVE